MKPLLAVLGICLFLILPVSGQLVEQSHPVFGPTSLTLDPRTGLSWLDVNYSIGLSYNQVTSLFGPGQMFEGFRLASSEEVGELFISASFPVINGNPNSLNIAPAQQFLGLLGSTYSNGTYPGIIALSSTIVHHSPNPLDDSANAPFVQPVSVGNPQFGYSVDADNLGYNLAVSFPSVGSWMVAVPEPSTYALAALAVVTACFMRRRKTRK